MHFKKTEKNHRKGEKYGPIVTGCIKIRPRNTTRCATVTMRRNDRSRSPKYPRKLAAGRTDLYIDGELLVEGVLRGAEFRGTSIHRVAVMEQLNGYAFLQPKHKALAIRLSATLTQMKKEGVIEAYRIRAMDAQAHLQSEPLNQAP
jgi:hypothetical protein